MNYDGARPLADGSGWHYTCHNRRVGTYPIGDCADHGPHATKEEAQECYRQYLLRQVVFHDAPENPPILYKCEAPDCEEYTAAWGRVGGDFHHWHLCDDHRNQETVEVLMPTVGESWHS